MHHDVLILSIVDGQLDSFQSGIITNNVSMNTLHVSFVVHVHTFMLDIYLEVNLVDHMTVYIYF